MAILVDIMPEGIISEGIISNSKFDDIAYNTSIIFSKTIPWYYASAQTPSNNSESITSKNNTSVNTPTNIIISTTTPANIELYVPQNMIIGYEYQGMVTHTDHPNRTILVSIAANKDAIKIDNNITIPPQKHHATFNIVPKHTGTFTISAKIDSITVKQTITIFDDTSNTQDIVLVTPVLTHTEQLIGAVYLTDSQNNPIIAKDDIPVQLQSSPRIIIPDTITIAKDSTGATFQIYITASGSIHATSGSMSDKTEISMKTAKPKLVMDVYPKIMQENSYGYWFIWFEDEDGNPYIPEQVTSGTIHSSNKDVARMQLHVTNEQTSSVKTTFSDGVQHGRIFTGMPGHASITGTMPGFGSVTKDFIVGPATFGTSTIRNDTITNPPSPLDDRNNDRFSKIDANDLRFAVIPPVTASEAYIITGLYHSITDESITVDADDVVLVRTVTSDVYPMDADARHVYIASDGAIHDTVQVLETTDIKTHVNLYDITAAPGSYQVSVTAPQISKTDESQPFTVHDTSNTYSIVVEPLPTIPGYIQDLAFLYIVDSDKRVINPHSTFGAGAVIHLTSDTISFSEDVIHLYEPVSIIRGLLQDRTNNNKITAVSNLAQATTSSIDKNSKNDIDTIIDIDAPSTVYSYESFAATAHIIKDDGVATTNISELISTDGNCIREPNKMFLCTGPGSLFVFSDVGDASIAILPNLKPLDVSIVNQPTLLSLGSNHTITVLTPSPDSTIRVDTAIKYVITDNKITLHPDMIGTFDVTILVSKPGNIDYAESIPVHVDDMVYLEILARDHSNNNRIIGVNAEIANSTNHSTVKLTDYTIDIPRQSITVTYPESVRYGNSGYRLVDLTWYNGTTSTSHNDSALTFVPQHSSTITANYKEVILVDVINGQGSGIYNTGDTVTITAPERHVLAFLVREVLDRWEGEIKSTEPVTQFMATEDITIIATYKTDYTGAVAVFAVIGGTVTILAFRGDNRYYMNIKQVADVIRDRLTGVFTKFKKRV